MLSLDRFSFHQLLLVAFLLIAGLLSAASLRGLFTIEALITQSSDGAQQAVSLSAAAQRLAERSVTMERAARQYLVLDDSLLRQRFDEAAHEAGDAVDQLAAGTRDVEIPDGGKSLAAAWHRTLQTLRQQLSGDAETLRDRECGHRQLVVDAAGPQGWEGHHALYPRPQKWPFGGRSWADLV